jgi:hypothetical protein
MNRVYTLLSLLVAAAIFQPASSRLIGLYRDNDDTQVVEFLFNSSQVKVLQACLPQVFRTQRDTTISIQTPSYVSLLALAIYP